MPQRVYTPGERAFEKVRHAGIAITMLPQGQQHTGLLHKDESTDEVRMLHLAWHNVLRNSIPKSSYAWIDPPIHAARARQVAARCRQVLRANPAGIPYAFSPASECFNAQTGAFLLGPDRKGLTCATFVLAVFDSVGLPLVQYQSWPGAREGDEVWQRHVVDQLKKSGASNDHIRAVETEVGSIRYRPEEVAGAAAADALPAPFPVARRLAQQVLETLRVKGLVSS